MDDRWVNVRGLDAIGTGYRPSVGSVGDLADRNVARHELWDRCNDRRDQVGLHISSALTWSGSFRQLNPSLPKIRVMLIGCDRTESHRITQRLMNPQSSKRGVMQYKHSIQSGCKPASQVLQVSELFRLAFISASSPVSVNVTRSTSSKVVNP